MTTYNGFTINDLSGYSYILLIAAIILSGSGMVIAVSHYFAKFVLIPFISKVFDKKGSSLGQVIYKNNVFHRIAYLIPAFIIHHFSYIFDFHFKHITLLLAELVSEISNIYILIGTSLVVSAILNCINDRYSNLSVAKHKPIKSYLQVAKIILFGITMIIIASIIFDKSPAYLFTGVSAATAFIALIFKDSILGFVASIQLSAYDMVRIGDWIEMPNFGADGEVMEISLNTVKVQNFDKTIVTIPSYALLTSGIKNWRGMQEAGGRRVKRSIIIDINSIKTCEEKMLAHLKNIPLMHQTDTVMITKNGSVTTNVGLFRVYLEKYLKQHHGVHKKMKILIRQLQGTPTGLPLELYFFTNEIDSEKYEAIQADIIEHAYAFLPHFHLRAFQYAGNVSDTA